MVLLTVVVLIVWVLIVAYGLNWLRRSGLWGERQMRRERRRSRRRWGRGHDDREQWGGGYFGGGVV